MGWVVNSTSAVLHIMDKAELGGVFNAARVMGKYPELLSDLNGVSYTAGGVEELGFGTHTEIFNDNITLKLNTGGSSLAVAITAARLAIREALGEDVRVMRADNNQSVEHVKFLVTLPCTAIDTVLSTTAAGRQTLKGAGLVLSDIDFTMDCKNITTRGEVERWIAGRYPVVDRRDRTGDNCISWLIEDPRFGRIRCKVYNKAVQMVESGGVRVVIGSSVHEYIVGDAKTQNTLYEYRSHGVSRLELTFYDETLHSADVYREIVLRVFNELSTCKTYANSLEAQWRSLNASVSSV